MKKIKLAFDSIIRLSGSLCLVIGVLFWVPGLQNRTLGMFFLWLSLLISIAGVVAAYLGKRSWYSVVILVITYLFMISRYNTNQGIQFIIMVLALFVSLGALANNFITRGYSKKLFFKKNT